MPIRKAEQSDLDALATMGWRFHDSVQPEWPWHEAGFRAFLSQLIDAGHVTISDTGFMAGFKAPHPLNPEWIVAHEILWWSEDRSGRHHFDAFREWASDAHEIKWSCRADNARVQRFYRSFGQPAEITYSEIV